MNPLSASSLNTERARLDASRTHAASPDPVGTGGGFAQLLQGARDVPPAPPASAQPPARSSDEPRGSQQADAPSQDEQAPRSEAKDDEHDTATTERARESGPTLAHWLLNGGQQQAAEAAAQAAVPPAQQAAVPTDDLKAAAMARQVLDAVRQRAKSGPTGGATAGAAADAAVRREPAVTEPGHDLGLAAVGGDLKDPDKAGKADKGDGRFSDVLDQAQTPSAAPALPTDAPRSAGMVTDGAANAASERRVDTPVQDPGFGHAVGVSISRLVRDGVHEARLQLNPAELGPVSVHIEMQGQEARLSLGAAHAETRALLDASLPALTEAFRADGLVLATSQVSELSPEQGAFAGQAGAGAGEGQRDGWAQAREGAAGQGGSGQRGQGREEPARHSEFLMPVPGPAARPGRGALGGLDLYA